MPSLGVRSPCTRAREMAPSIPKCYVLAITLQVELAIRIMLSDDLIDFDFLHFGFFNCNTYIITEILFRKIT